MSDAHIPELPVQEVEGNDSARLQQRQQQQQQGGSSSTKIHFHVVDDDDDDMSFGTGADSPLQQQQPAPPAGPPPPRKNLNASSHSDSGSSKRPSAAAMARRVEVRKRREKMARLASALPLASLSTSYQQELRWAIERRCGGKHAFSAPFSCQNDAICQDRLGTSISIETLKKEAFFVRRAERRQDVAKLRAGQV